MGPRPKSSRRSHRVSHRAAGKNARSIGMQSQFFSKPRSRCQMSETNNFLYALIRYHYDQVRDEAINVGVVVQGAQKVMLKVIEDWEALYRAYPFLDLDVVKRKTEALSRSLHRDNF